METDSTKYVFPHDVAVKIRMSSPLEENISVWNLRKTDKYEKDISAHAESN